MRSASWVALALLVLVPTASAADRVDFTFPPDFTKLTMHAVGSVTGQDAADMRGAADHYGNNDGFATEGEGAKMLQDFRSMIGGSMSGMVEGGNMTFDGRLPTSLDLTELSGSGFAGPITSEDALTLTLTAVVHLNPTTGDTHSMFIKGHAEQGSSTTEMTITAPSGFYIKSAAGIPGAPSYNAGRTTLTFTDTAANGNDGTVIFAKGTPAAASQSGAASGKSSPAAGVVLLLIAAGVAMVLRRQS